MALQLHELGDGRRDDSEDERTDAQSATCDYLKAHPGCTGVVMMDFAGDTDVSGDELLRAVIDQNFYCHLPCVR